MKKTQTILITITTLISILAINFLFLNTNLLKNNKTTTKAFSNNKLHFLKFGNNKSNNNSKFEHQSNISIYSILEVETGIL